MRLYFSLKSESLAASLCLSSAYLILSRWFSISFFSNSTSFPLSSPDLGGKLFIPILPIVLLLFLAEFISPLYFLSSPIVLLSFIIPKLKIFFAYLRKLSVKALPLSSPYYKQKNPTVKEFPPIASFIKCVIIEVSYSM